MIIREKYLNQLIETKDLNLIKVITGVRRSGKSTLLLQFKDYLTNSGIDKNNIIGVCPKHQKVLNDGVVVVGSSVIAWGLKKVGPKILKESVKLVKR